MMRRREKGDCQAGAGVVAFTPVRKVGITSARVAELVDALDSGSSTRKGVQVRVLSRAPYFPENDFRFQPGGGVLIGLMRITKFTGGMVQTNGYLVETPEGNFLVDAPAGIAAWVQARGVRLDALYLTHQHYDHVEDVAAVRKLGAKVHAWAGYSKELTLEVFGADWGLPAVVPYEVDELIAAGEREMFGTTAKVSHVPGHSADSLTIYIPEAEVLFAGDTLFAGSVGRCDLPGGSFELLLAGIERDLLSLPDQTRVLSGHGGETTIGRERATNGYLR
jgi:hydroxyacylglutathione hydrolase